MADPTAGNGAQPDPGTMPQLNTLVQYVKDLSFERPIPQRAIQQPAPGQEPSVNLNFDVDAQQVGDTVFEVSLRMEAKLQLEGKILYNVELVYAGDFQVLNVPDEHLHPFVHIECARFLFPFARQVVAEVILNGGFPALYVPPIDFRLYYQQKMQAAAGAQPGASGSKPS